MRQTRWESIKEGLVVQFITFCLVAIELYIIYGQAITNLLVALLFKIQSVVVFYIVRRKNNAKVGKQDN